MSSERAAIARDEVLRFLREAHREGTPELFRLTGAQYSYLSGRAQAMYPAPPAPVTVTVEGKTYERRPDQSWRIAGKDWVLAERPAYLAKALDRIAADARRIAELEQERDSARDERDEARRALDLANDNTRLWRERVIGLGASTTEEGHVERSSTAAPAHRREAGAGSSTPVAAPKIHSHSPAPIPLGATVEVEGTRWMLGSGTDDEEWCTDDGDVTHTLDHDAALAALYHARHPVATRETVERVAKAANTACLDGQSIATLWHDIARAALTAAGFTLEEGA